ncbi:Protein kinase domain and Serine/threonine-/dual specificity protein kinase, catalytic domain and Protein kinase-like domain-containing protein [Strongyloides ratti]|uniref:Protein kinase domain and Serine/threonine-/dual specificity protein kinase, catalytic domain and Protein kinase-like domain-containing protein n=1 Tax=Strongyloides ratti TaxID=34506 RepID=A0A090KX78_STRRB|nr:Protein kinase domain and Serine/threonine-/dual specificity protein kinase, catalytic domain and Protein kinase-like domain-containing protein [Strongyloides ratti]CEF62021.1 Protein kinase domain and Serine/threonine-/dual specificity protein kinase, catalytic domain and Protein kinase-like domain-containing protein [Strongyloides ratti]
MPNVPSLELNKSINCDFARFKVIKLLGKGGFGAVYLVVETTTKKKYAVKTELIPQNDAKFEPRLQWEETILLEIQALQDVNQKKHFIKVVDRGVVTPLRFLLMTLVGKSLKDLIKASDEQRFSNNTSWRVAGQTLEAIEAFHNAGFVHRNIKPHNFTIGAAGQEDIIFMLDFGLVRCYTGKKFTNGIKDSPKFAGTIKYCSRSSHLSVFQYPKDDLESWIMTVMEFHDHEALFWGKESNIKEIKNLKNDLFISKEPKHIFSEFVPIGYKKLVTYIGDLTPSNLMKNPSENMKMKINLAPITQILTEIGIQYNYSNTTPFDWQINNAKSNSSISIIRTHLKKKKHQKQKRASIEKIIEVYEN